MKGKLQNTFGHAYETIYYYSPRAAKRTRAAKRRVMMDANLAMMYILLLFFQCMCVCVVWGTNAKITSIYSEMMVS